MSNWTIPNDESLRDINIQIGHSLVERAEALARLGNWPLAFKNYANARAHGVTDIPTFEAARESVRRFLKGSGCPSSARSNLLKEPCFVVTANDDFVLATFAHDDEGESEASILAGDLANDDAPEWDAFLGLLTRVIDCIDFNVWEFNGTSVLHKETEEWCG